MTKEEFAFNVNGLSEYCVLYSSVSVLFLVPVLQVKKEAGENATALSDDELVAM